MPLSATDLTRGTRAGAAYRTLLAVVATNIAVLVWALISDIGLSGVMIFYWLENVALGVGVAARMLLSGGPVAGRLFVTAFFCLHYGGFCAGHGLFVMILFPDPAGLDAVARVQALGLLPVALVLIYGLALPLADYRAGSITGNAMDYMSGAYGRIVVLHIGLIAGGFVLTMTGGDTLALVAAFMLIKTLTELRLQWPSPDPTPDAAAAEWPTKPRRKP